MADNNEIFSNDPVTPNPDTAPTDDITADTLVGDGQKYANADELAKAYVNADARIAQLQADLTKATAKAEVLEDFQNAQRNPTKETPPVKPDAGNEEDEANKPPKNSDGEPKVDERDLSEIVRSEINKTNEEKRAGDNVNTAAQALKDYFGSPEKAQQAVQQKAAELDVSVDWLMGVAAKSPSALYRTMDVPIGGHSTSTPNVNTGSDVNVQAREQYQGKNVRGFKYYEELRKANKKNYYSRETQSKMFEDRVTLGEDEFYKH